jgi:hypothetical protein
MTKGRNRQGTSGHLQEKFGPSLHPGPPGLLFGLSVLSPTAGGLQAPIRTASKDANLTWLQERFMKIGDHLYFAPNIKFSSLDRSGEHLPLQYKDRIRGFYLEPAIRSADAEDAFASGLILVSAIDAISWIKYAPRSAKRKVGDEFKQFVSVELASFADSQIAERFYQDFRNGLVHECRIKNGGQFSLDHPHTVKEENSILSINPRRLADEVEEALLRYVGALMKDETARATFLQTVKDEFSHEL